MKKALITTFIFTVVLLASAFLMFSIAEATTLPYKSVNLVFHGNSDNVIGLDRVNLDPRATTIYSTQILINVKEHYNPFVQKVELQATVYGKTYGRSFNFKLTAHSNDFTCTFSQTYITAMTCQGTGKIVTSGYSFGNTFDVAITFETDGRYANLIAVHPKSGHVYMQLDDMPLFKSLHTV